MKKIKNILALLVVALMGLSLTACSEDDLDTNQYQKGVHLNVYGPQPVMRGGQLRFLGSNLDQIAQVKIPGCEPITNIDVVTAGIPSEIRVTVPKDGPEEGFVTLITKTDDEITTKTKLTYEEPIVFESFSPASVMPGETLAIKGDYLNLVHMIEFADGVRISEKDFVSHTRYQIEVVVPEEARTGKVNLFDLDLSAVENPGNAIYNIMATDDAINIGTPTITKWNSPRGEAELTGNITAKMGENITVTGEHFSLVSGLKFTPKEGDELGKVYETSDFTTSEDGKTLTFALPEEAADGDFNLICRSGVEIPVGTLTTVAPSNCVAVPSPVKAGAQLVITGKDLDVVNSIEMPNVEGEIKFIVNPDGTKLIIESVPETATEGNLVLRMKNGKGTEVPFTLVKPVVTGYEPSTVNAGGALIIKGTDLNLVKKVQFGEGSDEVEVKPAEDGKSITLTVPMNAKSGKPTLTLANGTTVEGIELNIQEAEFCYATVLPDAETENKAGATMTIKLANSDKLTDVLMNDKKCQYILTGENKDELIIGIPDDTPEAGKLTLISSNGKITYDITIVPATKVNKTLWSGLIDLAWNEPNAIYLKASSFEGIPAGAKMTLTYTVNHSVWTQIWFEAGDDVHLIFTDTTDGALAFDRSLVPTDVYGWNDNEDRTFETTVILTQDVLNLIREKGIFNIRGGNGGGTYLTKLTVSFERSMEKDLADQIQVMDGSKLTYPFAFTWSDAGRFTLSTDLLKSLGAKKGSKLLFYKDPSNKGQIQINNSSWTALNYLTDWNQTESVLTQEFDDAIMEAVNNGGLVIQGEIAGITKIAFLK